MNDLREQRTDQGEYLRRNQESWSCVDRGYWAAYQPCTLHIHAKSLMDLTPEFDDVTPRAISTHAHEYVHYLHSIGTAAGQAYLLGNIVLLRNLVPGTDANGHFLGMESLKEDQREWVRSALGLMQAIRGRSPETLGGLGLRGRTFSTPQASPAKHAGDIKVTHLTLTCSAIKPDGTPVSDEVAIGYSFVTEGVAYEVDRGIRRLQGAAEDALDEGVPSYPYLTYGKLVDSWVGRPTTPHERVLLGNAALGDFSVGPALWRACVAVKASNLPAAEALKSIFAEGSQRSHAATDALRNTIASVGAGPIVTAGLESYLVLVDRANYCREHLLAPELLLLEKPLDVEGLWMVMGNLVDAMVLQDKPGNLLDVYWIGPGLVAQDMDQVSRLAAVQSAFHFNHLHHLIEGNLRSTASIGEVVCRYKGACGVEVSESQAELCSTAPWMNFIDSPPGSQVCWYAAGVKAVRRDDGWR